MKRLKINVRFGATHIQSRQRFPFFTIRENPCHKQGSGLDSKTKLQIGEFRNQPGWQWFKVYSLG